MIFSFIIVPLDCKTIFAMHTCMHMCVCMNKQMFMPLHKIYVRYRCLSHKHKLKRELTMIAIMVSFSNESDFLA